MVISMELPKRKPNRLKKYDYSTPGYYFVTICTKDKKPMLSEITVGAGIARPPEVKLKKYGKIVEEAILNIPVYYPSVEIDKYVIMPNHIHLIMVIKADKYGRAMPAPTISTVINQMKGYVTKKAGISLWQKLFHDHIIRGEKDYQKIWQYINANPVCWKDDCFYLE